MRTAKLDCNCAAEPSPRLKPRLTPTPEPCPPSTRLRQQKRVGGDLGESRLRQNVLRQSRLNFPCFPDSRCAAFRAQQPLDRAIRQVTSPKPIRPQAQQQNVPCHIRRLR
jgi:hypothetical protein